jgi:hypothetical protein
MTRIYICYGITKSASTFAWQLIKRTAISGGLPIATLTLKSKGANSPEDYIDPVSEETIRRIHSDVGDLPVVIKTHGPVTPAAVRLVTEGEAQVFASYRDLRDVALSLLDHGTRSRRMGIRDFAEFNEVSDTISSIEFQVRRLDNWVKSCTPLLIPYDEICFDTRTTILRISKALGVSVDFESVFDEFSSGRTRIGQFNIGMRRRFSCEMSPETSNLFLRRFLSFYAEYYPGELHNGNPLQRSSTYPVAEEVRFAGYDHPARGDLTGEVASATSALPFNGNSLEEAYPEWPTQGDIISRGTEGAKLASPAVVASSGTDGDRSAILEVNLDGRAMTLTELANRFKSDKGTKAGAPPHRYTYLYDLLFWETKNLPINFLEIGLAVGGPEVGGPVERKVTSPSVEMWLSYFPNAHIYGFDISDFSHVKDARFTFVRGDAGSEADLARLAETAPALDVIIDDGSHASHHQQLALKMLFPKLSPGGIYIIEDLHWQSPAFEGVLPKVTKTAEFLQDFLEGGKYTKNSLLSAEFMRQFKKTLANFGFFGAFDGSASPTKLIVMRKVAEGRDSTTPYNSPLRAVNADGGNAAPPVSDDALITAAYKMVLGRYPDLAGLQAYRRAFVNVPLSVGLERTLGALLKSKEFQGREILEKVIGSRRKSDVKSGTSKLEILFIQTSDLDKYRELLNLTSQVVQKYCNTHEYLYESYLGVIRGFHPWQATFNRIPILHRLCESDFSGWVCYLDADAFVADLNFDLRSYLSDKDNIALIGAQGASPYWWAVNAGVLFFNFGHPLGRAIVREWHKAFTAITDEELRSADWGSFPDDQTLLHHVLRTMPYVENHIIVDRAQPPLINYEGRFIRQILRTAGSIEQRADRLRAEVGRVLEQS